jgi:hypothetical protein
MTTRKLRPLLALAAIAALVALVPGTATAKGTTTVTLSFSAVTQNKKPVLIKNMAIANVPADCRHGTATYSTPRYMPKMKVNDRLRFKGKRTFGDTKVKVTGKYKRNLQKITGTVKVKGTIAGLTHCNSGKLRWKSI